MTNLALTGILSFLVGCGLLVLLMTIDEKKTTASALVLILAFSALLYGVVRMCQNVSNDTDGNRENIELYHEQSSFDEHQCTELSMPAYVKDSVNAIGSENYNMENIEGNQISKIGNVFSKFGISQ